MSAAGSGPEFSAPHHLNGSGRNRSLRLAVAGDLGSGGGTPGLGVSVLSGPRRTVVRPSGELDLSTAARMETSLHDALGAGTPELVVDLQGLEFCDAAGLQVFLRARRAAFMAGVALWLERPAPIVRRVLEVSGLAWLIDDSAQPRRATS
jgi:anti-sigma B factor antagonist